MTEHIKINDTAPWISYEADGTTTAFAVPYAFLSDSDLTVWVADAEKVLTTDFTVSGTGNTGGGTVTFNNAPASGETVVISRGMAIERTSDFLAGSALRADALNTELDRLTLSAQEQAQAIKRGLRTSVRDGDEIKELPDAGSRANRILSFDANGDPEAGPLSSLLDQVSAIGTAEASATASAASAEANAAAAANSADDALDSAAGIAALVQNIPALTSATGDGATTAFVLAAIPVDDAALLVSLDGVIQHQSGYSVSGSTLTFASAPGNGADIEIRDLSSTAIIDADDVATLAAIDDDIAIVAGIQSEVSAIAADATDIGLVAGSITNVNALGGDIANVNTVAGDIANVNAVAGDATDIGTVATNIANVNAVGGDIANVNAVGTDIADVSTVASDIGNVSAAAERFARTLFRTEFPMLPLPGKAMTFFDGVSGTDFTVTRASTANTAFTKQRLMATVAANALRFEHDKETGEALGVRIEPSVSQLLTKSAELDHADWVKSLMTVTANQAAGADGAIVLDKLIPDSGGSGHRLQQSQAVVSGRTYILSGVFKFAPGGYTSVTPTIFPQGFGTTRTAEFDLTDGSVIGTPNADIYGSKHLGGGAYLLWIGHTATSSTTGFFPIAVGNGSTDGIKGVFAGQMMLQESCLPTSYIESDASEVTVDGDDLSLNPNSQDWHADHVQAATWFMDLHPDWLAQNIGFLNMESASGEGFRVRNTTGGDDMAGTDGALAATSKTIELLPLGSWFTAQTFASISGERLRVAVAFDGSNISFCVNGGTVVTAALAADTPTNFNDLHLGGEGTSSIAMAGVVRQLAYWPAKLSDADLVTLTTL